MTELYWVTRLDALQAFLIILFLISAAIAIVSFINWYTDDFDNECSHWKSFKIALPIAIISALGLVFVPSTKEMMIIYGIGGTVDYLKENDTAKQLPDKCIEALDKFVDEYIEQKQSK